MRRLLTITLLLLLVGLVAGGTTLACAATCADAPQMASPAPMMMGTMQHHHAMTCASGASFAARQCVGSVRLLAQRVLPTASEHSATPAPVSAPVSLTVALPGVSRVSLTASPPGPPVLPTQLRI